MNKLFKVMPFALGLLTLASCNSDELGDYTAEQAAAEYDGLIVTVPELVDANSAPATRAAFVEGKFNDNGEARSRAIAWKKGDQVKVYGMYNWRTQLYDYDEEKTEVYTKRTSANTFAAFKRNEESREKEQDLRTEGIGYALYPSKLGSFTDEDRTKMSFKLDNEFDYGVDGTEVTGVSDVYSDGKAYACPIPMWGYAKDNQLTFSYLTGFIRVSLEGMPASGGNLVVKASKPIAGDFEATAFDYDGVEQVPTLQPKGWTEESTQLTDLSTLDEDQAALYQITVKVPTTVTGDNTIYVPMPAGTYDIIKITYNGDELTWKEGAATNVTNIAEDGKVTVPVGKFLTAVYKNPVDKVVALDGLDAEAKLPAIKAAIEEYGKKGTRKQIITVTGDIAVGKPNTNIADLCKLDLSDITLTNDVELQIASNLTSLNTSDDDALQVIGAKGGKKVIIAYTGTASVPVKISDSENDITLGGGTCAKAFSIATTGDLSISGTFQGTVAAAGANLTFGGAYDEALTVENVGTVDINASQLKGITIAKAITVNINEDVETTEGISINEATNVNVLADKTVSGDLSVSKGTVALAGTVTNVTIGAEAALELTGKATTVTTNGGKIEANWADTYTTEGIKLVINAPVAEGIKLTNVNAKEVTVGSDYDGENTVISSYGRTAIKVSGATDHVTYKSYWNGNTNMSVAAEYKTAYIVTASQLKSRASTSQSFRLMGDIDLQDNVWNGGDLDKPFYGNGHTISNLTISGDAKGLFNSLNSNIEALNIEGVKYEGNGNGIGALAGSISSNVTIKNVSITDIELVGGDESYDIGGLIGKVTGGNVTIQDCKVSVSKLAGYYQLGGLIGSIDGNGTKVSVTQSAEDKVITLAANSVSLAKTDFTNANDDYCGRIGVIVGSILNEGSTLEFLKDKTAKNYISGQKAIYNNADLKFSQNWYRDAEDDKYGFVGPSSAYIGYSPGYLPEGGKTAIVTNKSTAPNTNAYVGVVQYKQFQINNFQKISE